MRKIIQLLTLFLFCFILSCSSSPKSSFFGRAKYILYIDGAWHFVYKNLARQMHVRSSIFPGIYNPACETLVYTSGDEKCQPKNGTYKRHYKNGQLAEEMEYKDGFPQGEGKTYYEDGTIKKIEDGKLINGKFYGVRKLYNDKGKQEMEFFYENQQISKARLFDENGKLASESEFIEGGPVYESRTYYPSGKLKAKGRWNGKKNKCEENSEIFQYYENGNLKSIGRCKNGEKYLTKDFYEDGTGWREVNIPKKK